MARISFRDNCRCWRTRKSDLDESAMCLWSLMLIRLTKRESERWTVDELSELSE